MSMNFCSPSAIYGYNFFPAIFVRSISALRTRFRLPSTDETLSSRLCSRISSVLRICFRLLSTDETLSSCLCSRISSALRTCFRLLPTDETLSSRLCSRSTSALRTCFRLPFTDETLSSRLCSRTPAQKKSREEILSARNHVYPLMTLTAGPATPASPSAAVI